MNNIEQFFDEKEYVAYPLTIKELNENLIKVIDDYTARKITNEELKNIIFFYADNSSKKLFNGSDYNITVKRKIGVKRLRVVDNILKGYQQKMI